MSGEPAPEASDRRAVTLVEMHRERRRVRFAMALVSFGDLACVMVVLRLVNVRTVPLALPAVLACSVLALAIGTSSARRMRALVSRRSHPRG